MYECGNLTPRDCADSRSESATFLPPFVKINLKKEGQVQYRRTTAPRVSECYKILLLLLLASQTTRADIAEVAYSFSRDGGGGVVVVQLDTTTGEIADQRIVAESPKCTNPEKVRRAGRNQLILTNETSDPAGPHLFLIEEADVPQVRSLVLPATPDEVRANGGFAVSTCDEDWVARVEFNSAKVVGKWNAKDFMNPPGNGPQDVFFLSDGQHVVLSFQKDSKKGKNKGSRIGVFRLPNLNLVADARLPRTKPELNVKGNKKESGPGPEVIHVSKQNNTIVVTLDLYGAVAIANWDHLLAGKADWLYLSTAMDGSWGNAFPDRMSVFEVSDREVALVANAGTGGGMALLDIKAREFIWQRNSPPGLEAPVYVPQVRKAYSVCSGKTKWRGEKEVEKDYHPQKGIYVCDFSSRQAVRDQQIEQIPTELLMYRITDVGEDEPWLLLAGGKDSPDTIMVLDARTGEFVDKQPAIGALIRFEGR